MNRQKPVYPCTCPTCGRSMLAAKSIAQEYLGINDAGFGVCKCGVNLQLTFHPESNTMIARPWNEYVSGLGLGEVKEDS